MTPYIHNYASKRPTFELTKPERRFARKIGWKGIQAKRKPSDWTYERPDGTHCGWIYGLGEIRHARTQTFLKTSKEKTK